MIYGIDNHIAVSPCLDTPLLTHVLRSPRKLSLRTFMHESFFSYPEALYQDESHYAPEALVAEMLDTYVNGSREVQHPAIMRLVRGEWLDEEYEGEAFVYFGGSCLDLDYGEMDREIRDKTLFAFNLDVMTRVFNVVNIYPQTADIECGRHRLQERQNVTHLAQVRLPFRDSNIDEGIIRLYAKPGFLPIGDFKDPEIIDDDYYDGMKGKNGKSRCNGFPRLQMTGLESLGENDVGEVSIRLCNYRGDTITGKPVKVYLECNSGYLPHRQVTIDPETGITTARVHALGMIKGDTMKVKCGFKFYTGASSLFIPIH